MSRPKGSKNRTAEEKLADAKILQQKAKLEQAIAARKQLKKKT
jgi:hypothetical protein